MLQRKTKMKNQRLFPLAATLCLVLSALYRIEAQPDPKSVAAADIVFLVDSSWSIGQENFQQVRQFLYNAVKLLDASGTELRFALVQYSGNPHTEFRLNTYHSTEEVLFHIWNMPYIGGGTKTGLGLEHIIQNLLTAPAGSRAHNHVPQVVVVLTDGRSQDDVGPPSSVLKSADVNMFAIGVKDAEEVELKEIASLPSERHVFSLEDFSSLSGIVDDLVATVLATVTSEISGEKAALRDISAEESADLVFLIDGSSNTGRGGFPAIRNFLINFIEALEVGENQIRVGVVQYSNDPATEFSLNEYSTKADVLDAVKSLRIRGGDEANVGAALDFVVENHFSQQAGSRRQEGVPQTLVLISSGPSSDEIREGSNALKQASVFTFAIGAARADNEELKQIATDESFVFIAPDFRVLGDLQQQLLPYIAGVAQRTVVLQAPTIITEAVEVNRRDIVFLIDGTAAMGNVNFAPVRDFVTKLVQRLDIGPELVQVAVAQYANNPKAEFYFNTHSNKKDVVANLKKLRPMGGGPLNTGAALDFVRNNFFTSSAGSRIAEGVPQFLVLLTGGKSRDDVAEASRQLKQNNLVTFTVGAHRADSAELEQIAFDASLVFSPSEFRAAPLQGILPSVLSPLKSLTTVVTVEGPTDVQVQVVNQRDIVFLLDGSVNVGNANFPFVRDFLISLIDNLDVSSDNIRIGLAQYSDTPKTEFYLNENARKTDVISRLGQLKLKGGSTLNTGAALNFVFNNFFTEAHGSRIDQRIPQLLVLLVAGKSSDQYLAASNALARAGILTFCVGARNADKAELEQIAFDPSMVYLTDDFSSLANLQQQMILPLTTYISGGVEEVPTVVREEDKKDIVFLLDGSDEARSGFPSLRTFVQRVVEGLDVGRDRVRISVVQYSDDTQPDFLLNAHADKQGVLNAIQQLRHLGGSPLNTGAALDYVTQNAFTASAGSRADEGVPQFLIFLTAGKSEDDVRRPSANLKNTGVVPFAVGAKNADISELQAISFTPDFAFPVRDFSQLEAIHQQLSSRVGQLTREEINVLIQTASRPQSESKRDILFLLDGSANMVNNFIPVRNFIAKVIEDLNVGSDATRVAVAQYSDNVKVEFKFDTYPSEKEVLANVRRMKLKTGRILNTGAALEYVQSHLFTREGGSRIEEGVPQILVLLSAGRSQDGLDQGAERLRESGVLTLAIKARNADASELGRVVLDPSFILAADNLPTIANIQPQLVNLLKTVQLEVTPTAFDESRRKDIVFLLDGSDEVHSGFPSLRTFVQRVVDGLEVGSDKIRVSVVQYSDVTQPDFLLNTYTEKQGVLSAIQRLSPLGGSPLNTGAALDYVTENVFTSASGSRTEEGVPQFLILLTAGKSEDDVRRPSLKLKKMGVVPFAVGAKNADITELQTISFLPDFSVSVTDFHQLENEHQTISNRVAQLNKAEVTTLIESIPASSDDKRDVVFLIDGSRSASPEFAYVRDFIRRVVDDLDVSSDKTRVAVVQFSEDPKVEFLLNTHSNKAEVLSEVQRLNPKGGRELNTGAALAYVSKNIFTRPSGSRIEEGVPQFLILLSSGSSNDDIEEGVLQVKQSGVASMVVGKNVDDEEMKTISLGPEYAFSVTNFRELPGLTQRLVSPVNSLSTQQIRTIITETTLPVPGPDGEKKDIVFLIDGSTNVGQDGMANIRDFILRIVEKLNVGVNQVRIGLVQYSNDPSVEFYLRSHLNKPAVLQAIRRLRLKGGAPTNTGKALEYVVRNLFVKSAGSRIEEGVPQHLVLLTGGKSQDSVDGAARLLGGAGVKSLAVGTSNTDASDIEKITQDSRLVFMIRDFRELGNIENRFFRSFDGPVEVVPTPPIVGPTDDKKEVDIVFLVDGSINVGKENFKVVLEFVSGIVDAVYDEGDAFQIGLAQYNSDVTDEFFLKDHATKDEILEAVEKVEYKGGLSVNTGAAIRHLQEKHFVKEAGSRSDRRVPQIAFVITGGKSSEDVLGPARSLASSGVNVFAIGLKDVDQAEVDKIASASALTLRVMNVQELSELNEQVLTTMEDLLKVKPGPLCPSVPDITRACNLEVIVGFDVSSVSAGEDIFTAQKGLEPKIQHILDRISKMHRISCSSTEGPTVRVSMIAQSATGPVEIFDFSEYKPELFEKFTRVRTRGPYIFTARTLQTYLNKFKTGGADDTVKVVIHLTDGVDEGMAQLQAASAALQNGGVKAMLLVGLEGVQKFEDVMHLEFGRGFTYNRPLKLNLLDLDYEIAEELDNIAEKACCGVPCKCSGQRGDRGSLGAIGPKGAPGEKGHRGFPGEEGGAGERGSPGVTGTQGFQGCPGQRGVKGTRGFSGEKGELGELGLDGIDGEDGDKGIPGPSGERGDAGGRGDKGLKGERGERGDGGLRGDSGEPGTDNTQRGPRGPKGEIGPLGEPGVDGQSGPAGAPGKDGGVGRRGPLGAKGNRGGPGPAGSGGEQGTRGPQGPLGPPGTPGVRGDQGSPGPRGSAGIPGVVGDRGRLGPIGQKGEPGDPGVKGVEGPLGPRGETGDDGRDGAGRPGPKGKKGENGFPGYPGPKGDAGDQALNGDLGPKGNRGRRGRAGEPGTPGQKGENGNAGPHGLKGASGDSKDQCSLVKNIKDNCPCCYGPTECPVYPTELAFALDTSSGVNQNAFNSMKQTVLRIVRQLTIAESNCPRGARAAVVTYNSDVTTEIRFSDSHRKTALIQQIENLQVPVTTKQRSLENVMSFVARNTFKRARSGFLMRKVAVFFSNGPARASPQLNEAVLKLYDAGVSSLFLTNRADRALSQALQVNSTELGEVVVVGTGAEFNRTIEKALKCHVCLDVCDPDSICGSRSAGRTFRDRRSATSDVDIDIAFVLDSSETTNPSEFLEMKRYISHVVSQLEISSDPKSSAHHARVAILQHAPYEFERNVSTLPVQVEMSLVDYGSKESMQHFIMNKMVQLDGIRAARQAIEYTMDNVFEGVPHPRDLKVFVLMMTGEVKGKELTLLQSTIIKAKCKGFFFVVLGIGKKANFRHLYSFASEPHDVFFKRVEKASELHGDALLRFGQQLAGFISSENAFHLSPEISRHCDWFQADQPEKSPFQHASKQILEADTLAPATDIPAAKGKSEINISDVTENSVRLRWLNPEPQHQYVYDITITSARDHSLVLKQNISGTERVIGGLRSGYQYDVMITGYYKSQAKVTFVGTFSTQASPAQSVASASGNLMVNTEPQETPETDLTDPCLMDFDMGMQCTEFQVKWFFDYKHGICTQVWYGGCGGNENKFDTEAECLSRCSKPSAEKVILPLPAVEEVSSAVAVTDICKLEKDQGPCRNHVLRWHYDPKTKSCARFWYGGCSGNDNRFDTQKECEKACVAYLNPGIVTAIGTKE
ncbi:collagen alpha-3(VI) chain [Pleurodeles waltl]|uniref:collagen alpha-3(VI) chain n=1 Tax=Pleurodeles waltl TaxID=8319 RepID=UPI00370966F5